MTQKNFSQDHDMRISIKQNSKKEQLAENILSNELVNQDVDMRLLPMRHIEQKKRNKSLGKNSHSDASAKNTQSTKQSNDHSKTSSQKTIDYSQYLKDANIDLNQSDLEDPLGK